MLIDVKTNFRLVSQWMDNRGWDGIPKPEAERMLADFNTVLIRDIPDLTEMRDWLTGCRSAVRLYATLDITKFQYRIERRMTGLILRFDDQDEAFHGKFRWG